MYSRGLLLLILCALCLGCTDYGPIPTQDGYKLYMRTMDYPVVMGSTLKVIDKGTILNSTNFSWTTKYPYLEITSFGYATYAVNIEGLSVGALYVLPNAYYPEQQKNNSLAVSELIPYLVSTCRTISDVQYALFQVNIWKGTSYPLPSTPPLHFAVHAIDEDAVIEFYNKTMLIPNKYGALANVPVYDTQSFITNNYSNIHNPIQCGLSSNARASRLYVLSHIILGNGLFSTLESSITEATYILNTVTIPDGIAYHDILGKARWSRTIWSILLVVRPNSNYPILYFREYNDLTWKIIDMNVYRTSKVRSRNNKFTMLATSQFYFNKTCDVFSC